MPERNSCSWNAMLAVWAQQGDANEFKQLFLQMMQEGILGDRITCMSMISFCIRHKALLEGKRLHASTVGSVHEMDTPLQNALISLYGKFGNKECAIGIFNKVQDKSLITWNAMIAAFGQLETTDAAKEFFTRMQMEGVLPDEVTFSTMLTTFSGELIVPEVIYIHAIVIGSMHEPDVVLQTEIIKSYGNCGRIEDAQRMFDWVTKKDIAVWNVLIMAYSYDGNVEASFSLFCTMLSRDQTPNKATFVALLSVCAKEALFTEGNWIFEHIVSCNLELELGIGNSLVSMYGRCGRLEDALEVFSRMQEHDLVSWSILLILYTEHDLSEEALHLVDQMLATGITPDEVVLLCILPVCESTGALMRGRKVHHYIICGHFDTNGSCKTALLNMYSECGSSQDAQRMFDSLVSRNMVSWNSLVAMHAHYGCAVYAILCSDDMRKEGLVPDAFTFYSMLSACSHAGLLEEGIWCFSLMAQQYHIIPTVEHFNCMVDLFGRAGQLDTLEFLLRIMGLQPSGVSWTTMFGACRVHLARTRSQNGAMQAVDKNPEDMSPLVLLSEMYC